MNKSVSRNEPYDQKPTDENIMSQDKKRAKIVNEIKDIKSAYEQNVGTLESTNTKERYESGKIDKDTEKDRNSTKVEIKQIGKNDERGTGLKSYANILTRNLRI